MKNLLFVFLFSCTSFLTAQESILDPYKYVFINPLNHQGVDNQYGVTSSLASAFKSKGFVILNYYTKENMPTELKTTPCLLINATPIFTEGSFGAKIQLDLRSYCGNDLIFSDEFKGTAMFTVNEAYTKSIKKMVKAIEGIKYNFNPSLTPVVKMEVNPDYNIENTGLNKKAVREYLTASNPTLIEGIYKSFDDINSSGFTYEIGLIQTEPGKYQGVILASDAPTWENGEIKILVERTAVRDIYSVEYFMGDKTKIETFATCNGSLLKIDLPGMDGETSHANFIKTFPYSQQEQMTSENKNDDLPNSSGTGFVISEDGLLVTNYHVVKGANLMKVIFPGRKTEYQLELLQKDELNDMAILKVKELDFEMDPVPYNLGGNGVMGQDVFTIGYPLGEIMGKNQKVSNGIINAVSGIEDDVRFYQVSVPIQPGNSGGPLFDMKGNVLGITTATLNPQAINTNTQNVNYAVKINNLQNILSTLPPNSGISLTTTKELNELPISLLSEKYKAYIVRILVY